MTSPLNAGYAPPVSDSTGNRPLNWFFAAGALMVPTPKAKSICWALATPTAKNRRQRLASKHIFLKGTLQRRVSISGGTVAIQMRRNDATVSEFLSSLRKRQVLCNPWNPGDRVRPRIAIQVCLNCYQGDAPDVQCVALFVLARSYPAPKVALIRCIVSRTVVTLR